MDGVKFSKCRFMAAENSRVQRVKLVAIIYKITSLLTQYGSYDLSKHPIVDSTLDRISAYEKDLFELKKIYLYYLLQLNEQFN